MADNILETTAIRVVIDDSGLQQGLQQAIARARETAKTPISLNTSAASKGMSEALAGAKALGNEAATLRQRFQATGQEFTATKARLAAIKTEALSLSKGFADDTVEARRFAQAARYADATIAGMEGRMSRLGLASQVNLAGMQSLSMEMYRFGPAGMAAAGVMSNLSGAALGAAAGVAGIGIAAAGLLRTGIPEVEKFQKALQLMISTGNDLTASTLTKALDDAAAAAGKAGTQFSRADLADSLAQLVKAGVSAAEAMKLLAPSMQLAIESDQNLTDASTRLLQNLRSFGLGAEGAQRAADDLAKASLISAANAQQLSEGLANIGPVANEAGLSLESTLGALVTLSNSGLDPATKGSNAFRVVMTSLLKPSRQAEEALQALGVATKDAAGHQRDMQSILSELVSSAAQYNVSIDQTTGQVTGEQDAIAELARIFRTRGITAIAALSDAQRSGITTWADYTRMVKDGQGELKSYADTLLSNNLGAATKGLQTATKNLAESFTLALAPGLIVAENQWASWLRALSGMHQPMFNLIGDVNNLTKSLAGVKSAADLKAVLDTVEGELTGNAKKAFDTWRASIDLTTASLQDVIKYAKEAGVEGTKALAQQALGTDETFQALRAISPNEINLFGRHLGGGAQAKSLDTQISQLVSQGNLAQASLVLGNAIQEALQRTPLGINPKDMTVLQDLLTVLQNGSGQQTAQRVTDARTQAAVQKAMQTLPGQGALQGIAREDLLAVKTANQSGSPTDILAAQRQLKQDEAYYDNLLKTAKADYTFTQLVNAVQTVLDRTKEATGQVASDAKAIKLAPPGAAASFNGMTLQDVARLGANQFQNSEESRARTLGALETAQSVYMAWLGPGMDQSILSSLEQATASADQGVSPSVTRGAQWVAGSLTGLVNHTFQTGVAEALRQQNAAIRGQNASARELAAIRGSNAALSSPFFGALPPGANDSILSSLSQATASASPGVQPSVRRGAQWMAGSLTGLRDHIVQAGVEQAIQSGTVGPGYFLGQTSYADMIRNGTGRPSTGIAGTDYGLPLGAHRPLPGENIGPGPNARGGYNDFTRVMFKAADRQRQAADDAAKKQDAATMTWVRGVDQSAQTFMGAIKSFQSGDVGGGIAGLANTAGGIASMIPGGQVAGAIITGVGDVLGGLLSLGGAPRAAPTAGAFGATRPNIGNPDIALFTGSSQASLGPAVGTSMLDAGKLFGTAAARFDSAVDKIISGVANTVQKPSYATSQNL